MAVQGVLSTLFQVQNYLPPTSPSLCLRVKWAHPSQDLHMWAHRPCSSAHTPPTWPPHSSFLCSHPLYMPPPLPGKISFSLTLLAWKNPNILQEPAGRSPPLLRLPGSSVARSLRYSAVHSTHACEVSMPVSQRPPGAH